jgi:metal-responsive CopG/Arc/MetJ family transcriptional regulator
VDAVTFDSNGPRVLATREAQLREMTTMAETTVRLRLNQQQLELIDNSVKAGESSSREDLIRRALREFAAAHLPLVANRKKS